MIGDVGEHLAVDLDAGLLQPVDQTAVGQTVVTRGGVDTGDPERAEFALFLTTVTIGVLAGLDDRLLGDPEDFASGAIIALGLFEDLLVPRVGGDAAFDSWHSLLSGLGFSAI